MILTKLPENEDFTTNDILKQFREMAPFCNMGEKKRMRYILDAFRIAKKHGIIEHVHKEPISFADFVKIPIIADWIGDLTGCRYKHKEARVDSKSDVYSTQSVYSYKLWNFNNWLYGRDFETTLKITNADGWHKFEPKTVTLQGLTHFFQLYKDSDKGTEFAMMLKSYLKDPIHKTDTKQYLNSKLYSIQSFFKSQQHPIKLIFNSKNHKDTPASVLADKIMTLSDLTLCLTNGRPTKTEIAVIMCMFQAGLDSSTFADRFNFEAWDQLVKYFGTDDFESWDIKNCPTHVLVERMKTSFEYWGKLDVDAINSLKNYLRDVRIPKHGSPNNRDGKGLFLNNNGNSVTSSWCGHIIPKLAKTAGILQKVDGYSNKTVFKQTTHELRDLLDSILSEYNVSYSVKEHAIGHKPQSSYTKDHRLNPEKHRLEYGKISNKINIFSKMTSFVEHGDSLDDLTIQRDSLQLENYKLSENYKHIQQEIQKYKVKLEPENFKTMIQDEVQRQILSQQAT